MALPIEVYAIIADTRTAGLVGRDDSNDWLCLPRLDSGACFAALLGEPRCGRWLVAPVGGVRRTDRRYRYGTLVLETAFITETGAVRVIDCMCNDVGLLSEEYDPAAQGLLDYFPQAFSHVGLVNTAFNPTPRHVGPASDRKES